MAHGPSCKHLLVSFTRAQYTPFLTTSTLDVCPSLAYIRPFTTTTPPNSARTTQLIQTVRVTSAPCLYSINSPVLKWPATTNQTTPDHSQHTNFYGDEQQ
ncbi:hypothetical protein PtA15_1A800 [Puccinia triticina]|uniref:Uncharacterized protein n=1 Tax=Puccinia triticina TaxID=208348 RepID=A0ABY7C9U4_9BASI|nr:uncharacterized protein PtA15_1A800 [Puccinia triticina]WAQ81459.1 hypothetical protein PtA15_1A800 [Puccinia triticina]